MDLRALLRRRHAVSADAPSQEVLGVALEARRGRGEHTAEGARRLSGQGWRRSSRLRRLERMDLDRWMAPHQDRAIVFINPIANRHAQSGE